MDIDKKKKIAMAAEHCLRCFAPNIFVKTRVDTAKHQETECYVNGTDRHKFTCLNRTCLLHSWICKDHIKENRPQSETHDTESMTVWRSLLTRLEITSSGIICKNYRSPYNKQPTASKKGAKRN